MMSEETYNQRYFMHGLPTKCRGFTGYKLKWSSQNLENKIQGFGSFTTWSEMVEIGVGLLCSLSPPRTFALLGINLVTDEGIGIIGEEIT